MYTQKKIHAGLVGSLVLIAALVIFFFHTKPARVELNSIIQETDALRQEVQNLSDAANGSSTSNQLSEVEERELGDSIPETLEQDFIVTEINRVAKTADVSFNVITFSLQESDALPMVTISAAFQGTSNNITRFLKMLEINKRKFVIKDAGISRTRTDSGLPLVNLTVTIQAFYRKAS